jgi:hypothetical protein
LLIISFFYLLNSSLTSPFLLQAFSTESDEKATTQHVAFPFDSGESNAAFGPALERLSRAVDTDAACGYVTLVNLARRPPPQEEKRPSKEEEDCAGDGGSPSTQHLGKYSPHIVLCRNFTYLNICRDW